MRASLPPEVFLKLIQGAGYETNKNQKKGGTMNIFKKTILSLLSTLPLGAISHAAEFEKNVDMSKWTNVQTEFEQRLQANELPEKYYNYLSQQNIIDMDELTAERNHSHYQRLLKEFQLDLQHGVYAASGAISIGGTF